MTEAQRASEPLQFLRLHKSSALEIGRQTRSGELLHQLENCFNNF
jgi:hypothetical protein